MGGGQLLDTAECVARGWNVAEVQIEADSLRVDRRRTRAGKEREVLRGECKLAGRFAVQERFLPEAVAREYERSGALIPDRESEHAIDVLDEAIAEVLVEM